MGRDMVGDEKDSTEGRQGGLKHEQAACKRKVAGEGEDGHILCRFG